LDPPDSDIEAAAPCSIYIGNDEKPTLNGWSVSRYRTFGKTCYISTAGDDANDGLRPDSPKLTLSTALAMTEFSVYVLAAGTYYYGLGWDNTLIQRSIGVICEDEDNPAILSVHANGLSWSLNTGSTYEAVLADCDGVRDFVSLDIHGDGVALTERASIADVDANAGSWYWTGGTVYVRTSNSRVPDANVRCYRSLTNSGRVSGPYTFYLENLEFHGGNTAFDMLYAGGAPTLYAKDCVFKYGVAGNGLSNRGGIARLESCVAARNESDGFSYSTATAAAQAFEFNCTGRHNGVTGGGDNDQGSTAHGAALVIRVGCKYYGNKGQNVADIDTVKAWSVGCDAYSSDATEAGTRCNWSLAGTSGVRHWMEDCKSWGSVTDYSIATTDSHLYQRTCSGLGTNIGTIESY